MPTALITGAAGLVGGEAVRFYCERGWKVVGVDNDQRSKMFGTLQRPVFQHVNYEEYDADIRDLNSIAPAFILSRGIDLVIHAAAQPSHDYSADHPLEDFAINATGTLNVLEATRLHAPDAVFIFTSTNKVIGGLPWAFLNETPTRWEPDPKWQGFDETFPVDQIGRSMFGTSKAAADLLVQEYAHTYRLKTGIVRCGCITGPAHAGAMQHGFAAYLIQQLMTGGAYKVLGYKGKQVRDQIAAIDLVLAFEEFRKNPAPGEVFMMGGGRGWDVSILEFIDLAEQVSGKRLNWTYDETPRRFDHQFYCTNTAKFERMYPNWKRTKTLRQIVADIVEAKREAA